MKISDLDYTLPDELIATTPPPTRDGGRLLLVDPAADAFGHAMVRDLVAHIPAGALLVVNDTRVINARLRAVKPTGGRVELLLVRAVTPDARSWTALGRATKGLRDGAVLRVAEGFSVRLDARGADGALRVTLLAEDPWGAIEAHGEVPLPPYMRRAPDASDRERYQTVYAREAGAVAAPTAGLHFTAAMFESLAARGVERVAVTLHVGPGTFAPVVVDDLDQHAMHSEWYRIPDEALARLADARRDGRPVVAVGTTVVRTLESWAGSGATSGDTRLLIQPGFTFRVIDALVTNLHLPRSTLIALVMAFAGEGLTRRAYEEAVRASYRFFSYGDAMFIRRGVLARGGDDRGEKPLTEYVPHEPRA
jgi:S-adenosylmethionine:tRNA ribosyltransferase-isomerase